MCGNCNGNCNECIEETHICNQTTETCDECAVKDLSTDCIVFTDDSILCGATTVVAKNTILSDALKNIVDWTCTKESSSTTTLKNVGTGAEIYKGISLTGEREIRKLKSTNGSVTIALGAEGNDIDFSVPEAESQAFPEGTPSSTITVGGILTNTVLENRTALEVLEEMLIVYQNPTFSTFSITNQPTTVEVGTTLTGSKVFTWTTTNLVNVSPNSLSIFDATANSQLVGGLAENDTTENVAILTNQLNDTGVTQSWKVKGSNTKNQSFESANFTVTANYYRYFGASVSRPTNSTQVRALPSSAFQVAGSNTFTLNTGTTLTRFIIALPPTKTITSAQDLDALNANMPYILVGTVAVLDAGGTSRNYNLYELILGDTYPVNHRHQITTN